MKESKIIPSFYSTDLSKIIGPEVLNELLQRVTEFILSEAQAIDKKFNLSPLALSLLIEHMGFSLCLSLTKSYCTSMEILINVADSEKKKELIKGFLSESLEDRMRSYTSIVSRFRNEHI